MKAKKKPNEKNRARPKPNKNDEIEPLGKCETVEDCVPYLRDNVAGVVRALVKDALNAREGRKHFIESTGLKEHFSKMVFEPKKEARAFLTTEFERDMLEGLRQLTDDDSKN